MTDITVKSLAAEIKISVSYLIQKFADAGIHKIPTDTVTCQEKELLLTYLNRNNSTTINQLTLQRKTRSILNIPSIGGKRKSVQIEVRKKRTYIQQDQKIQDHIEVKKRKIRYEVEKKIQQRIQCELAEKDKYSIVHQIKHTDDLPKLIKTTEKTSYDDKVLKFSINNINNKEEEKHSTSEELIASKTIDVAHHIETEYNNKDDASTDLFEEDITTNYHITKFYHSKESEDENDRKAEMNRRGKARSMKASKQKKVSRISESKANREEIRIVGRSSKHKRKPSTLTQSFNKPIQAINRDVIIGETISVAELANKMAVKSSQVIKVMMKLGAMVTINQVIDQETAQLVAEEMGHKVILLRENELEESVMLDRNVDIFAATAETRAPVVTIMGHVDHGKTSLLDYIRSTKVAAGEAGGITQHIGAYHVETNNGMITFLDTPGHAAFTAMRARGVQVTDIVVLVVAADDGVMPQTIEAIKHAKAAKVPIVVAVNKIDKTESDLNRVKNELIQHGIIPEEWGGENQFVYVSAKTGIGIDELLDAILLQAEILELKAIYNSMASGVVIESFLDKSRGAVATILVREGTLNRGDILLCGFEYGRVRAMRDELGRNVLSAGPSIPVEIIGLSGVPTAGDEATVVRNERKAREVALYRQGKFREIKLARHHKYNLENVFTNMIQGEVSELNIVLKSDAQGSAEAISSALEKLSTHEVKIKIICSNVGGITETDATLAAASNAILLGFNVRADASARRIIESENIDLRYYSVIYDLINEVKQAMNGMLTPEYKQQVIGLAEVRNVFYSPKFGAIAGCMVTEGMVKCHNKIRVLREHIVVYEGELESLRRFKDDINEVRSGMECGIGVKNYNDVRSGDIIEVFETVAIKRVMD